MRSPEEAITKQPKRDHISEEPKGNHITEETPILRKTLG